MKNLITDLCSSLEHCLICRHFKLPKTYFCEIKIIFAINQFQIMKSLQLWKKISCFFPQNSPNLLNDLYINNHCIFLLHYYFFVHPPFAFSVVSLKIMNVLYQLDMSWNSQSYTWQYLTIFKYLSKNWLLFFSVLYLVIHKSIAHNSNMI